MKTQRNDRWFHPRDFAYYAQEELNKDLDHLLVEWSDFVRELFNDKFEFQPRVLVNYNPPTRISCTILQAGTKGLMCKAGGWLNNIPEEDHIARFALSSLPGCKSVLVSHLAWVHPQARGNGIAPLLHIARNKIALDLGAGSLVCTVRGDNEAQHRVMQKVGWETAGEFNTVKEGEVLRMYTKKLPRN